MKKFFVFLIFILVGFGVFFWSGIYLPKDFYSEEEKIFLVEKDQNVFQIGENLEKEGLIKNRYFFDFYVLIKGTQRKLQAGEYKLSLSMGISEIAQKIISGDIAKITVTIPEGFTVKQIEERLGFDLPGENLEGFLFPDTYQFPINVKGEEVVARMKENFDRKLTTDLREEIERQGKTIFEIVTMASLIEKEVRPKEVKKIEGKKIKVNKLVSGILWKRLENNIPLQVDATIAYILNGEGWAFDEMRREIAAARDIDDPYNTYKYPGLPPGPICNPGLESILTAVYPKGSEYWYYLSTPESETIFSKTLEEHNITKAKYLK